MRFFLSIWLLLSWTPGLVLLSCGAKPNETSLIWNEIKRLRLSGDCSASETQWETLEEARKLRRGSKQAYPTSISTNRRACRFYFWDFVSAGLYHTCKYLMKDRIYEGRGGRKFVRIEPGSLLQLLHPCSRHNPDKCVFCGGTFQDHLTLRWSKHLYSPYDLCLDRTYERGVLRRVPSAKTSKRANLDDEARTRYAFHGSYVLDMGMLLRGVTNARGCERKLRKTIAESEHLSEPVEMHAVDQIPAVYVVPSLNDLPRRGLAVSLLKYVRNLLLDELDALMVYQEIENREVGSRSATIR